jgi:low temperature requirement protein LtrA
MLKRAHTIAGDLDARFGRGSFVIVTTEANHGDRFHWFRLPTLRQEWLDEDKKVLRRDRKDRKANLMELYYDLIFVAVIGLLGHSIRLQSTLTANFFIDFIALFHIWMETLYFLDRFDSGDGVSRVLILFTMAGVVGMGMTGLEAQQQTTQRNEVSVAYAVSFVWARTSIEVLYAMTLSLPNVRMCVACQLCQLVCFFFSLSFLCSSDSRCCITFLICVLSRFTSAPSGRPTTLSASSCKCLASLLDSCHQC